MIKNFDQRVNDLTFHAESFAGLGFHHGFNDLHVDGDIDARTIQFIEVVHGFGVSIGGDNDFDVFGEVFG